MTDLLLRMLLGATLGLVMVLLLRRPVRRIFGAGPAFTMWLLPVVLALAPLLPRQLAPALMVVLPALIVTSSTHVVGLHAGAGIDWVLTSAIVWLAGATLGIARLAWHYLRLCSGARGGSTAWLAAAQQTAPGLDVRRVRMHAAGPAVLWALPRTLVLLPEDFAQRFGNATTRELVLRHELTHVRRADAWWSLAMEIASALLWFHPLAWIARSRFRLDQELACDAAALRAIPAHTAGYAHALLDSVAMQPAPALIPWLAEPQLKERIAMLTRIPPGILRRHAGFVVIAALLWTGLLVAGGQASVQAAQMATVASTPPTVDIAFKQAHQPAYPVEALKKGEQGTVMLRVSVDATGKITDIEIDPKGTTGPANLQVASIKAAQNWKFRAGIKNGKPVGGSMLIPVQFSLTYGDPCKDGETYSSVLNKCIKLAVPVAS